MKIPVLVEVLLVTTAGLVMYSTAQWLYGALAGALGTGTIVILATVSMRLRGKSWVDLGAAAPKSWIGIGLHTMIGVVVLGGYNAIVAPAVFHVFGRPDLSELGRIAGNPLAYFVLVVFVWTVAAFGEEMAYRGYFLNRLAELWPGRPRLFFGLVASSLLFGMVHLWQGLSGAILNAGVGFILGALYLYTGRDLWPVILTHGIADSLGLLARYVH